MNIDSPKSELKRLLWDERSGLPWTTRINLPLVVLVGAASGGVALLALGLYLSLWVRIRRGAGWAFFAYLLFLALVGSEFLPFATLSAGRTGDAIGFCAMADWFLAAFLLRSELAGYFAEIEGVEPRISAVWTALFTTLYLNYYIATSAPDVADS